MTSLLTMPMSGILPSMLLLLASQIAGDPSANIPVVGRAQTANIATLDPNGCLLDYQYKHLQSLKDCEDEQNKLNGILHDQEHALRDITKKILDLYRWYKGGHGHGHGTGGATYIRWGKTSCQQHAKLVYTGYAAGSLYGHPGGATSPLCLPKDPEWASYDDGNQFHSAYIYGAEYEFDVGHLEKYISQLAAVNNHDVPCAVCCAKKPKVLMMPAKTKCPAGWTLEYKGYLMAGTYNQDSSTKYVCLDGNPEVRPGTGTNDNNGYNFATVQTKCGSLKCPPFVKGRELACIVCSK